MLLYGFQTSHNNREKTVHSSTSVSRVVVYHSYFTFSKYTGGVFN